MIEICHELSEGIDEQSEQSSHDVTEVDCSSEPPTSLTVATPPLCEYDNTLHSCGADRQYTAVLPGVSVDRSHPGDLH